VVIKKLSSYVIKLFPDWMGLHTFYKTSRSLRSVVFYAESSSDWAWLGQVADCLENSGQVVARVTSDELDPVLKLNNSFYIGSGSARTIFFRAVDADIFVMTLTDLNLFYLKRSKFPVHYIYLFHSIASMHRVYRQHALDFYDTIFCVGPHHLKEIRKTETIYGLKPKVLVEYGYARLDTLIKNNVVKNYCGNAIRILVAPTWGSSSLISNNLLNPILFKLIDANFKVVLRLHPMVKRDSPKVVKAIISQFSQYENFRFDPDTCATNSLLDSDVMISEWSGAALEYAFALERPVIFIDTQPKVFNFEYHQLGLPCFEEAIRTEIGVVVPLDSIGQLPEIVLELKDNSQHIVDRIRELKSTSIYNIGSSAQIGSNYISEWLMSNRNSIEGIYDERN
jgi:hypothetical protein